MCDTSDLNSLVSFCRPKFPSHCNFFCQMYSPQVLGNVSNNHYVYVGGLPSWYLAKLKVSHLIFRLPRIFSKCLRLLCFDFRDCCRELYFYSINLLLTLDPHAPPMEAASFNRMKISCDLQYFSQDQGVRVRWRVVSSIRRI